MSAFRALASAWLVLGATLPLTSSEKRTVVPPPRTGITYDTRAPVFKEGEAPYPRTSQPEKDKSHAQVQEFARSLSDPSDRARRPRLFGPKLGWQERCREASSLLKNHEHAIADVIVFFSNHLDDVGDPQMRAKIESSLKKYLSVPIPVAKEDTEKIRAEIQRAGRMIEKCTGLTALVAFSGTEKFEKQYPKDLAIIIEAILSASRKDPDGPEVVRKLSEIISSSR